MDIRDYKEAFLSEAQEYVSTLNNALVALEKDPSDTEQINAIFRAAHTLKGMSATMGYTPMARLTHQMESALDPVRSGRVELTGTLTDALFSCLDLLEEWLKVLQTQDAIAEGALPTVLYMIEIAARGERSLSDGVTSRKQPDMAKSGSGENPILIEPLVPSAPPPAVPNPMKIPSILFPLTASELDVLGQARSNRFNVFHLYLEVEPGCAFKDVRAFMVLRNLNEIGEIVQSSPGPEEIEKGQFAIGFHLLLVTEKHRDVIRDSLMKIIEISAVIVEDFDLQGIRPMEPGAPARSSAPSLLIPSQSADISLGEPAAVSPGAIARNDQQHLIAATIRVHTSKLDKLMALVQELVIAKIRFEQVINSHAVKELQDPFLNLHHITRDLQDEIMQVRLVPIKQIFDRFPRMIRDLSKQLNKDIEFIMEGAEVELDRTIVDELSEPLVHLLRNAVDHGLETTEERLKAGKNHKGVLRLIARRERAYVHVSVIDDGRGIDSEKVRQKAVAMGILAEAESRAMSEEEIVRLISLPGMSTVQKATDVSGRGVGVDVAKTKIESLGGTLQIHTRRGQGTTFNLKFPLTLAIIKSLLVNCGGETFALPVSNVTETVDVPIGDLRWVQQQETLLLRDAVVPLYRLRELLEMSATGSHSGEVLPEAIRAEDGQVLVPILIFEVGDYRVGVIVDEVLGQQEIAIKSLDRFLKGIRGYAGATILGNGRICLVLDVAGLLEELAGRRHSIDARSNLKEGSDHATQSR